MAGIQPHYEINVSFRGRHLFATNERSATDKDKAQALFNIIRERFPAADGYKVEITQWHSVGSKMTTYFENDPSQQHPHPL